MTPSPLTARILGEVQRLQSCDLGTLRRNLSDLSWSQVFMEIDRLSRAGELLVTFGKRGRSTVRLPDLGSPTDPRS
ncbi:hypothetical protein YTPLAS18_31880 [Nitrospira sp.]|nr:hypothetical protein YTPLAS18_31880 [Nitrospira sp.]